MEKPSVVHNTFIIERIYPKPPEYVFTAFADPRKKRRWFAEGDHHAVDEFEMDFRVGGAERLRYRMGEGTPVKGLSILTESRFVDIAPNRRVVVAQTMDLAGKRISASLVTFELLAIAAGTKLICTHQGAYFEGADGPRTREAGWNALLERLQEEVVGS